MEELEQQITSFIEGSGQFDELAAKTWDFQKQKNPVLEKYCSLLNKGSELPGKYWFLPIELFKDHKVISYDVPDESFFESSGTTGQADKFIHHIYK